VHRGAVARELCVGIPAGVAQPEASWAAVRHLTGPSALVPFAQIGRVVAQQRGLWKHAVPADGVPAGFKQAFLDAWEEIAIEAPLIPRRPDAIAIRRAELDPVWISARAPKEGAAPCSQRTGELLRRLRSEGLL
jgi:hypothetical protein